MTLVRNPSYLQISVHIETNTKIQKPLQGMYLIYGLIFNVKDEGIKQDKDNVVG